MEAEKKANPGYRAYLADGYNVTRTFVLFFYEVILELVRRAPAPARRAAARAPLGQLRVHALRPIRVRARLHRAQHHQRHDDGRARRLRLLRRLRRGRAPLGPRARRRDGGPAQARPAVRAHRARPPVRRRGPTRSSCSPTTARRRARPSCSATATGSASWSSATLLAAASRTWAAGDENDTAVSKAVREATGRKQKDVDKHQVGDRKVVVMGSGNLGLIYLMDEPRRLTLEEIERAAPRPAAGPARAPARGLAAGALAPSTAPWRWARRRQLPERGPRGGRGPAGAVLAHGRGPSAAHRRLHPRRRHHGEQLLRRAARRGLRVRGAHLVPRRHRRPADAAVPAASGGARGARRGPSSAPRRRTRCWRAGVARCRATRRRRHPAGSAATGRSLRPTGPAGG